MALAPHVHVARVRANAQLKNLHASLLLASQPLLPFQRQRHLSSKGPLFPACVDMAEQFDEESQMRAARAEIMAVSDMFHRYDACAYIIFL